jgi:hypothetical protein
MDVRDELSFLFWGLMTSVRQGLAWIKAHPTEAFLVETGMLLLMLGATWQAMQWMKRGHHAEEEHDERL